MSSQFLTLPRNDSITMCNIRCWVVGTRDQSRMMLQSITISKTTQNLQAGHYSLVERLLYAGKPNILASTWPFSFLHPAPWHRDALKCEARADPNGAVQSMQTPVLGPKICLHFFNQFALDLQLTTIRNWTCNWKSGISLYLREIHPSVEQLLAFLAALRSSS